MNVFSPRSYRSLAEYTSIPTSPSFPRNDFPQHPPPSLQTLTLRLLYISPHSAPPFPLLSPLRRTDYQEDRAKAIDDLNELIPESTKGDRSIRRALYCVFDGHGGDACSEFLFQNFHKHLLEKENLCEDPKAAIMSTWDECEEQFQSRMTARYDRNAKVSTPPTSPSPSTVHPLTHPLAPNTGLQTQERGRQAQVSWRRVHRHCVPHRRQQDLHCQLRRLICCCY